MTPAQNPYTDVTPRPASQHGLTEHCSICGGGLTLWASDADHCYNAPITSCERCLVIYDTPDS